MIDIKNGYITHENQVVLRDVNLSINKGEFVFLVGKTGSGKTSLLSSLYKEIPIKADVAQVANFDLLNISRKRYHFLRKKIGFVFQDFKLLMDRNVYENLEFVLIATGWKDKKKIQERIESVLNYVNIIDQAYQKPYKLSRGQQQMVSIARSLLNDPDIILADEPSANLDPDTTKHVINMLYDLSKGDQQKAVFVATHQYFLLKMFTPTRTYLCQGNQLHEAEL